MVNLDYDEYTCMKDVIEAARVVAEEWLHRRWNQADMDKLTETLDRLDKLHE